MKNFLSNLGDAVKGAFIEYKDVPDQGGQPEASARATPAVTVATQQVAVPVPAADPELVKNLDASAQKQLIDTIGASGAELVEELGDTIFVVAHDIAALVQIADTLWLFSRERDEHGAPIPGATIKKEYNLIERGLAWRPDIVATREFADMVTEVRGQFKNL